MPEQLFANVASTTLASGITSVATSMTVVSSANFPAADSLTDRRFHAAFVDSAVPPNILEYIAVTQVTGTTWTVERAAEDAARFPAAARGSGVRVIMVVTRGVLESFERRSRTVGHNILDFGAVGNSNHNSGGGADDTLAIQAAQDESQATGGYGLVIYPGSRSYRITSTIMGTPDPSKSSNWQIGLGAFGAGQGVALPNIVWDGAVDGTMHNTQNSGNNIPAALFRNLRYAGRNIAATAIRMGPSASNNAKLDSGTGLDEVWMAALTGDAFRSEGIGATNFWIRGGRWDRIQGYAVYMRVASQTLLSIRDVTWDATDVTLTDFAKGFMHLDASGGGDTAWVHCRLDTIHPESGGLKETNASGTTAGDKRGIIACSINSATQRVQFQFDMDVIQCLGHDGSDATHSLVQMLGGGGATESDRELQRSARLVINGRSFKGLGGDGTAALGQLIPIGGIPSSHKSSNTGGNYYSFTHAPQTLVGSPTIFGSEVAKNWAYVT